MKKNTILVIISVFVIISITRAQELFSYTEPASNMAVNSLGVRLTENIMNQKSASTINHLLVPEIMFGVSRKIMIHTDGFISNLNGRFKLNGGSLYLKYRFFSRDDIHSHFRMAIFTKYALNNLSVNQPSIDLRGQHSGFEMGLVSTKLINKVALSSSVSVINAQNNLNGNTFLLNDNNSRNAINYTFSIGKLMMPKEYVSYNQTNVNAMVEILGQSNLSSGLNHLDIAPVIQFIIKSKIRVDVGYRIALSNQLLRKYTEGGMIRLEYNLFNVIR